MVPAFKGLGYAMIVVRFFVNIYYVVITAWSLYYLAIGFQKNLPWSTCDDPYNTFDCYSVAYRDKCVAQNNDSMEFTFYKQDCVTVDEYCQAHGYSFGDYVRNYLLSDIPIFFKIRDYRMAKPCNNPILMWHY